MVTSYPEVEIRMQLVQAIRQVGPDAVLSWNPYANFALLPSEGWDDLG
jgi:isocitrate lyase